MAWSTPRTWSPGETVTASLMNAQVRDNFNALGSKALILGVGKAGGVELATGVAVYFEMPISMTITGWTLIASVSGSIVLDVWNDTYANFPPTVADTITGTEKPTLSSAQINQDLSLTSWDGDIDAGDVLAINIDSVTTIPQFSLSLRGDPR
jgi:hypothetical protein